MSEKPNHDAGDVQVQIKLSVPEGLRLGTYANFLRVGSREHDFNMDFALLPAPADVDTEELRRTRTVEGQVVARIILPASVIPRVITALQQQLDRWYKTDTDMPEPAEQES